MQWVLIDRVGHLVFFVLTKVSGLNRATREQQDVKHFSSVKKAEAIIDSPPVGISGWTVAGWREDDKADVHTISPMDKITMEGDMTIYAVYRRDATFYSGVSRASSRTVQQFYNTCNKYSVKAPLVEYVQQIDGFSANGWSTASEVDIPFGATFTGSVNTFYAKYQRNVTFYHGINKASSTTATQYYYSSNSYKTVAPAISKATDIGNSWTAVDWLERDNDQHITSAATYTGNKTVFYAYYKRTATINYSPNGGTGETQSTTAELYYDSSNASRENTVVLAENEFTRTGYNFTKWNLGNEGAAVSFSVNDPATKTASAEWAGYTYTVTYKQGSATSGYDVATYPNQTSTYPTPITLHTNNMTKADTEKSGTKITVTFNANTGSVSPTSATSHIPIGYTKNGWTKTSGSTTKDYTDGASYTNSETDNSTLILYPCFRQDDKTRTAITMPTPTKTNYTCTGWFDGTASNANKLFACGQNYNNITKSQTVYAHWTNADKRITFSNVVACVATSAKKPDGAVQTFKKAVYNVTFSLKAAMTWQQMVNDATYKWPTAFSGKIGSGAYSFPNPESFNYTTRSAVQAGSDDCYLQTTSRNDLSGTLVFFPGYSALNNTTVYAAYNYYYQIICNNTTTQSAANNQPADPTLAGATIAAGSTYYMTSGSNTDATVKDNGNFTFRQGT